MDMWHTWDLVGGLPARLRERGLGMRASSLSEHELREVASAIVRELYS